MKVKVYDIKNKEVGEVELSDKIFAKKWNPDLIHQILLAKMANRRKPWAHAKHRGEVRGGGVKPWRQKGTGRARHGSIRSPLWKGGGATHGPLKEKDYSQKINKKMLQAALHSALSRKLADGELKVINNLNSEWQKTKQWHVALKGLQSLNSLLVPTIDNKNIYRACRNIPKVKCLEAGSLNVEDVLKHRNILIDEKALSNIR